MKNLFCPAACTSDKTLCVLQVWNLCANAHKLCAQQDKIASADKGTCACGPVWNAACCAIILGLRQYACVLCLAYVAPDRPASSFFAEDKRRLARQTRQVGCRPPTRITTPDVVLPREKPCVPLSADAFQAGNQRSVSRLSACQKYFFDTLQRRRAMPGGVFSHAPHNSAAAAQILKRRIAAFVRFHLIPQPSFLFSAIKLSTIHKNEQPCIFCGNFRVFVL